MKDAEYWLAGAGAVACVLLATLANGWILRGGLAAVGIAGLGAFLWSRGKQWRKTASETGAKDKTEGATTDNEINSLISSAEVQLGGKIASAPVIFVLGQAGSGKTSAVANSGLEPQILAGEIEGSEWTDRSGPDMAGHSGAGREGQSNIWLSRGVILLEAANGLLLEPKSWSHLVGHLAPRRLRSFWKKNATQPARAALVCVNCKDFVPGKQPDSMLSFAKTLRKRLKEICQRLGIHLPVYVVFTNADRLKFFTDYARNMGEERSSQPLGVTLAMGRPQAGAWEAWQAKRLRVGLDEIFYVLCQGQLKLVSAEHDEDLRRGICQFPREFRKLRRQGRQDGPIIKFLIELCRPYQLGTEPFLRGFYFTGTRGRAAQAQPDNEAIAKEQPREDDLSATRIAVGGDSLPEFSQSIPSSRFELGGHKEWLFLTKLFNEVLAQDHTAMGVSAASSRVDYWRRVALASVAALFLLLGLGSFISYLGNRHLESEVLSASHSLTSIESKPSVPISLEGLQGLESLRQLLDRLMDYRRDGIPWRLRFGLYVGNDLYTEARKTYFDRFGRFMLDQTQTTLREGLRSLPESPGASEEYKPAYDALKAYLITTFRPEKSTRQFLSPELLKWWERGRAIGAQERDLARLQFDFYSEEQRVAPPFGVHPEDDAVFHARRYLEQFSGVERVYQLMLSAASRQSPPLNFNRQFAGSDEAVVDSYEVPGEYTKAGWNSMQEQFRLAGTRPPAEDWVVMVPEVDRTRIEQELQARYEREFIEHWRQFLENAHVARCRNPKEAARKLNLISSNPSPLLGLFCVVSQNVAVESAGVKRAFEPVQSVVPPNCQDRAMGEPNRDYIASLFNLEQAIQEYSSNPNQPDVVSQVESRISSARAAVHQIETGFQTEPEWQVHKTVASLLYEPIKNCENCMTPNVDASGICGPFRELKKKYPFNPSGAVDAAPKEIDAFFNPKMGTLWSFVNQNLAGIVTLQGSHYIAAGATNRRVRDDFLRFLNNAKDLTDALYPTGSDQPQLRYRIQAHLDESLQDVTLSIDGRTVTYTGKGDETGEFVWPGNGQGAEVFGSLVGGVQTPPRREAGTWGVFRLLGEMNSVRRGETETFEWIIRARESPDPFRFKGNPVKLQLGVTGTGLAVFGKGYFSGLDCVPKIVQ